MTINIANWKTGLGGIIAAIGAALVLVPLPEEYKWVPSFLTALGGALVGITAKDYNVHSTEAEVVDATVKKEEETKKKDG